jgi:hypothetical protein
MKIKFTITLSKETREAYRREGLEADEIKESVVGAVRSEFLRVVQENPPDDEDEVDDDEVDEDED